MEKLFFRKRKLNKKGSHVGIILSFTIFITALIFIFSIFGNMINTEIDKKDKLNYLEKNLIKEVSEELVIVNIKDNGALGSCSQISTPIIGFSPINVLSIDSSGNEFASALSGSNTIFDSGKGFLKLYYFSEGLSKIQTSSGTSCVSIQPKSTEYKKFILELKINETVELMQTDYEGAKELLEISLDDEFDIEFIDSAGNSFGGRNRDLQTEIYAREINVNYLSKSGVEKNGKMVIKIW